MSKGVAAFLTEVGIGVSLDGIVVRAVEVVADNAGVRHADIGLPRPAGESLRSCQG